MTKKTEDPTWPDPPDYLSKKSQELFLFYRGVLIRTPGQFAMFTKGLEMLDQAHKAGEIIRKEGLTVKSERSGMSRQHPAVTIQKESLGQAMKVWKSLGLNRNSMPDPSGWGDTEIT